MISPLISNNAQLPIEEPLTPSPHLSVSEMVKFFEEYRRKGKKDFLRSPSSFPWARIREAARERHKVSLLYMIVMHNKTKEGWEDFLLLEEKKNTDVQSWF